MNDFTSPILIAGLTGCLIGGAVAAYCSSVISTRKIDMYKRTLSLLKLLKNNLKQLESGDCRPAAIVENSETDAAVSSLVPYLPVELRKSFNDLWMTYRYDRFSRLQTVPAEYTAGTAAEARKLIADRTNELITLLIEILYEP